MKPENFITVSEVGRRYDYTPQAVKKWILRGLPYNTNNRKIPEKEGTEWIIKNILNNLKTLDTSEELKQAKLRRENALASMAEMDEATQAGDLIPVSLVQAAVNKHSSTVRSSMLQIANVDTQRILEAATSIKELKQVLTAIITERLTDIGQAMQSDDYLIDEELTELSGDTQNGNDTDTDIPVQDDNGDDGSDSDTGCDSDDNEQADYDFDD
ncbi:hypothetical protein M977_04308 [Buttiauxella gaviniae ATCC 51604]|uniref:Terminase small subunit n=1 Tax=Buttiauxella gaviniae ATCC 51604 TaxID=1354253 RepID=A0A1B7HN66_9ENTR|nr:hypothetical protein [Buttiauxella gaviniae]OAT17062.1 hypothetical protein M977_04308 [Buttiauxella gaviniae ATCC 51604]